VPSNVFDAGQLDNSKNMRDGVVRAGKGQNDFIEFSELGLRADIFHRTAHGPSGPDGFAEVSDQWTVRLYMGEFPHPAARVVLEEERPDNVANDPETEILTSVNDVHENHMRQEFRNMTGVECIAPWRARVAANTAPIRKGFIYHAVCHDQLDAWNGVSGVLFVREGTVAEKDFEIDNAIKARCGPLWRVPVRAL
jgi:hypothetical protein